MNDDAAARKTYRYARLGMIGAVVLLAAAVLLEHHNVPGGCWQTSISAYYYTPVRAVFVGALTAIGLTLIVIKGSTWQEDICLNVAGMLAPIVALAPTSDAGACFSIAPVPLPTIDNPNGDDPLAKWVIANIHNNIQAFLVAGVIGLLAAAVAAAIALSRSKDRKPVRQVVSDNRGTIAGLVVAAGILAVVALAFYHWPSFDTRFHGFAAMAMFGFLALAAAANGWDALKKEVSWYPWFYFGTALLMAATALLMFKGGWHHKVLWVEVLEITWFVVLWTVQSRELWIDTLRRPRTKEVTGVSSTVGVTSTAVAP